MLCYYPLRKLAFFFKLWWKLNTYHEDREIWRESQGEKVCLSFAVYQDRIAQFHLYMNIQLESKAFFLTVIKGYSKWLERLFLTPMELIKRNFRHPELIHGSNWGVYNEDVCSWLKQQHLATKHDVINLEARDWRFEIYWHVLYINCLLLKWMLCCFELLFSNFDR